MADKVWTADASEIQEVHKNTPGSDQPLRRAPDGAAPENVLGHADLTLESVLNFRDVSFVNSLPQLGDGVKLAPKRLFRCANPYNCTEEDARIMFDPGNLGIKTILDLRTDAELKTTAEQERNSVLWKHIPRERVIHIDMRNNTTFMTKLFTSGSVPLSTKLRILYYIATLGMDSGAGGKLTEVIMPVVNEQGLLGMYLQHVEDYQAQLVEVLQHFARAEEYPLLIHCTGGKDRTGVVAALVMGLAGVPEHKIVEDFNVSEEWSDRISESTGVDANMSAPHLQRAPKETMRRVLAYIKRKYGSIAEYLAGIRLPRELQAQIRDNMLGSMQSAPPRCRL